MEMMFYLFYKFLDSLYFAGKLFWFTDFTTFLFLQWKRSRNSIHILKPSSSTDSYKTCFVYKN